MKYNEIWALRFVILLSFWGIGFDCFCQVASPVTVVRAPILESYAIREQGMLATMNVTLATIEEVEQKMERLQETTEWLNKLESMQEFIELLETTACLARDLNVDLQIGMEIMGRRANCFNEFTYKVNINQLRYVVDVVNVVLSDGFNMSRAGRLEAYQDALGTFEEAQLGLGNLQVMLRRVIYRYERAKRFKDEVVGVNGF